MEIKELDKKIDSLEDRIKIERKTMEHFIDEFIDATKIFSKDWIKKLITDGVKSEPHITINMDKGKLKELKSKYQDLSTKIAGIVENEFNDDETWKHRILLNTSNDEEITPYSILVGEIKNNIDKHCRRILGYGGALLLDYGYYKKHQYRSPWKKTFDGRLKYISEMDWSPQMNYFTKDYTETFSDFHKSLLELKSFKTKKAEIEAIKIWDDL
ncbi:MAG: hypothetical protein ACLQG5_00105 [Methanobacterium sp.]|jgi:hypothetical protein